MRRSVWRLSLLMALAAMAPIVPAGASTFLAMSQEELIEEADSVVQGRVVAVESFWNRQGTAILTEAVVEVEEAIVGDVPGHVRLTTFGGKVGDYVIEAHGFPTFQQGERLLVFLEPRKDGAHRVLGYQQGQFRIRRDGRGRDIAVPAIDLGARIVKRDGSAAPAARPVPVEQLQQQIRDLASQVGRTDVQP